MARANPKRTQTLKAVRHAMAQRPSVIELFTGVGGMSLGLEMAGFNVAVAVEIEELAGRYAQYNFPASRVLYGEATGDVRDFGSQALKAIAPELLGEISLVAGGPPCQGFSLAGKKDGADPLNDLVGEFARVVSQLKPMAFLMENVPGITMSSSTQLRDAVRRLGKHYRVTEPTPLWASDFGVPQARQRVFLLGIRRDLGTFPSLPAPTHVRPAHDQLSMDTGPITPTVWEALSDIPAVDEYPELIDGDRVAYDKNPESEYQSRMRAAGPTKGFDACVIPTWDSAVCTNLRRTQHGPDLLNRFAQLGFAQIDRSSGIRRLDPNDVATTIRAGTTKERGSWSAPRPLHPFQNRVLTTRECARLQSFPDWFFFHPIKWHGNRQVGNAVPPLLARAIGSHILQLLGLPVPATSLPEVERDDGLVREDILRAAESGLSRRKISQMVVHPKKGANRHHRGAE